MDDAVRGLLRAGTPASARQDLEASGFAEFLRENSDAAVAGLFQLQGRELAATPALDVVATAALGVADAGVGSTAVVFPCPPAADAPPAIRTAHDEVSVDGLVLCEPSKQALVVAGPGILTTVDSAQLRSEPVTGWDPDAGLVRVSGEVSIRKLRKSQTDAWPAAIAACRLALAHELIGVAEAVLDLARAHVLGRVQFGRPLAVRQAVKHRLADVAVAVAAARAMLAIAEPADPVLHAVAAKALAGRAALLAGDQAMQVCGAMGVTREYRVHQYVRRAALLDALLGCARVLQHDLGRLLLERTGHVPTVFTL